MRFLLVAFLVSSLATAGCSPSTNRATTRAEPSQNVVPVRLDIRDAAAAANLQLVETRVSRTPGGVLKAEVEISNELRSVQRAVYRFEWFDRAGSRIESMQSQQLPISVDPGAVAILRSIAPSEAATDFRLQLLRR